MDLTGLTAARIADLAGVSLKTATRWKRQNHIPYVAQTLVDLKQSADLGHLAKPWAGFRLADGLLWTPEDQTVSPGDIRAIQYRLHQIREYEREMQRPRQFVLL
jgi:hypothetical protein